MSPHRLIPSTLLLGLTDAIRCRVVDRISIMQDYLAICHFDRLGIGWAGQWWSSTVTYFCGGTALHWTFDHIPIRLNPPLTECSILKSNPRIPPSCSGGLWESALR
ncbi:hypothetical protein F5B21DRAFT_495019 [Xylaria acuta]|nr:hypothetical protein F5B21DRAFT_495019 [Xylaria acuta]